MIKPTLAEIRYYQVHGTYPKSLVDRMKKPGKTKAPDVTDAVEDFTDGPEWPKEGASGWWELSNGKKVQGEEKARAAQAKLG